MSINHFLDFLELNGRSPETLRAYKRDVEALRDFLAEKHLRWSQMTFAVLEEFLRTTGGGRDLAPASIRRRLAAISSYLDYRAAHSNGRVRNPLRGHGFRRPRRPPPKPQGLDEVTLDKLLTEIPVVRDRALVATFVSSGLRISELHQLNRGSIQVKRVTEPNGTMTHGVGEIVGKGKKLRMFLVDESTCQTLGEMLAERGNDNVTALFVSSRRGRLSVRAIRERIQHWCKSLNLPHFRVHQLRHTFATRMVNAGMGTLVLRDLLGHSSFDTTLGYIRMEDKNIARQYFAAMESLPGGKLTSRDAGEDEGDDASK
jgi:site-specific recombinase XerC